MKVGSKVVCVVNVPMSFKMEYQTVKFPVYNKIYTIRDTVMGSDGEMKCRLVEIVNGNIPNDVLYHNTEVAFPIWAFRETDTMPDLSDYTIETLLTEIEEPVKELA